MLTLKLTQCSQFKEIGDGLPFLGDRNVHDITASAGMFQEGRAKAGLFLAFFPRRGMSSSGGFCPSCLCFEQRMLCARGSRHPHTSPAWEALGGRLPWSAHPGRACCLLPSDQHSCLPSYAMDHSKQKPLSFPFQGWVPKQVSFLSCAFQPVKTPFTGGRKPRVALRPEWERARGCVTGTALMRGPSHPCLPDIGAFFPITWDSRWNGNDGGVTDRVTQRPRCSLNRPRISHVNVTSN